jgi:hypothetical protein
LRVGKVALVAPWINPDNNPRSDTADFFDFDIDPDFPARTAGVTVFVSSDDEPSVLKTVDILRDKVHGLEFRDYADKGHFVTGSMKTEKFPELLEVICK